MGSRLKLYSYDSNLSTLLSRIDRGLNIGTKKHSRLKYVE